MGFGLCGRFGRAFLLGTSALVMATAPGAADTTPPVTTSDVQAIYEGGAVITFQIIDGGKVGIGTTFYKLDDEPVLTGGQVLVNSPGPHTLDFWSVDQAGNVEDPPNTVTFEILGALSPDPWDCSLLASSMSDRRRPLVGDVAHFPCSRAVAALGPITT